MNLQNNMLHINQPYAPRLHARSARMRTARHKAPCRFVYNAAAAAEMHAPYGRGPSAWGHPLRWEMLDVKKTSEIFSEVF